ncbi:MULTISPECIES: TadE/TadG family type IV pilus assembly protein [unclassified Caulobacter]|uniref:TadE/TadG family type IV pilus assembly protein n=1 Tax=unclassified Caulobacter TaxID=2648921 RepID=UPI000D38CFD7|nr:MULTISPECIES: TadE/TadG family type IV pilus assembly protein [unclassified Caulobacter]PTS88243.1 pilus assembly protein TadE [Caulobacter sp. HMWF009]PTT07002.1 pilus assembly protein TadE [Caulobacter sp. HMWF025]
MARVARPKRPSRSWPLRDRLLARFARAERGATTIEFAFVAIPFLLLIFAIIELGLVFLVSVTLENAVIDSARTIRTGEVQTGGGTANTFKAALCTRMSWVGASCTTALTVDVRTFSGFSTTGAALSSNRPASPCWDPGGPGSVVLVRAYYNWPLLTPLLQTGLQSAGGKRLITAASAFSNEPYSDTPAATVTCPA